VTSSLEATPASKETGADAASNNTKHVCSHLYGDKCDLFPFFRIFDTSATGRSG
jgi:hypothetical protein